MPLFTHAERAENDKLQVDAEIVYYASSARSRQLPTGEGLGAHPHKWAIGRPSLVTHTTFF